MRHTLVLYTTKYGTTAEIARQMALVLGPARALPVDEFGALKREADFVVLAAPVYGDVLDPRMIEFARSQREWLLQRPMALLCVALAPQRWQDYLAPLAELLGESVAWSGGLGGRLDMQRLDAQDRAALQHWQRSTGMETATVDRVDPAKVVEAALSIKALKDTPAVAAPSADLKAQVEGFLRAHNTCTLVTGHGTHVRGTPIEYSYHEGALYLLSEGGEKFAHLLLNPRVSLAIYDPYVGMARLAGLQLSGRAQVLEPGSAEYAEALALKDLTPEQVAAMPLTLNALKVTLEQAEFLWSGFVDLGYDVRQILRF